MRSFCVVLAAGLVALAAAAVGARRAGADASAPAADDRQAAADTVALHLRLASHLAGTSGDERFAERLPAAREVVSELLAEIAMVRHAGRIEIPQLMELDVRDASQPVPGIIELRTREYWVTRATGVAGEPVPDAVRSDVVEARYTVGREAGGWRVLGWELDVAGAEARRP